MWKGRSSLESGYAAMGFPGQRRAGIHAREFSTHPWGNRGKQNTPALPLGRTGVGFKGKAQSAGPSKASQGPPSAGSTADQRASSYSPSGAV